jgi:hypothetical protein
LGQQPHQYLIGFGIIFQQFRRKRYGCMLRSIGENMKSIVLVMALCSLTAFAQTAPPPAPVSPFVQQHMSRPQIPAADQANAPASAAPAPEQTQSIASLKEALSWQKKLFKMQISAEKTQAKLQQEKLRIEIAQREAKRAMSAHASD